MEGKQYQVRNLLILDDDRKKQIVSPSKDTFVIKAPFPRDLKNIARQLAIEYNGLPVNSFSVDDRYLFERDVTLDTLIEDSPQWWTSAEDCPDEDLKEWLYNEINQWSKDFQEKLKKNKFTKRSNGSEV